jgi:hypothetical protein
MQLAIALAAILLVVLAGCESPAPLARPEPPRVEPEAAAPPVAPVEPPPPPVPTPGDRALADGIALYDKGDFNGAIKRLLGAKEIWTDSTTESATATKLAAHKYLAFSYCVTKRRTQCRRQFVDALKLDPGFNLDPTEETHPIWGPEFERAKKQANTAAAPRRPRAPTAATPSSPAKAQ